MNSQANVRVESVLRPSIRSLPSVIVDTEKVLREAARRNVIPQKSLLRVYGVRPGVRFQGRAGEAGEEPEEQKRTLAESGHPVFRATNPLSRGALASKGGGKIVDPFLCRPGNN